MTILLLSAFLAGLACGSVAEVLRRFAGTPGAVGVVLLTTVVAVLLWWPHRHDDTALTAVFAYFAGCWLTDLMPTRGDGAGPSKTHRSV